MSAKVPHASTIEISLVLGLPMAMALAGSTFWLARSAGQVAFTDARLLWTLTEEVIASVLLLPYLRRRGWSPIAVAGAPQPLDVLRGWLVWLASMAAYYLSFMLLLAVAPSWGAALKEGRFAGGPSIPMALAVAVLNPLFEEFLWLGYTIPALEPRIGLRAACIASLTVRVAVHAYQGPMALVGVLPLAAVFTWYYARTGRLWPVIVAHVIADALGLLTLHR